MLFHFGIEMQWRAVLFRKGDKKAAQEFYINFGDDGSYVKREENKEREREREKRETQRRVLTEIRPGRSRGGEKGEGFRAGTEEEFPLRERERESM